MDESFLDAFQVGAGLAERRLERDFRERQFVAQEAERALQARQALQEMQLNDLKVNQISDEIARRAKQQAELDLAYQGYAKDHAAGVPMEEALFKNFSGPAARYGSDPLEVARQAATFQREKIEGPLRQQKLEADIGLAQARTASELSPRSTTSSAFGKLLSEREEARLRGDSEAVRLYDAMLEKQTAATGMQVTTNPDGTMTLTQGPLPQKLPSSVTAKAEERMTKNQKVVEELNSLSRTLRPQDIGVKGVLGETVLDAILPQFGIPSADAKRMDNRTKLKAAKEGALRMVSDDSRFSNADRKAIEDILPNAGLFESYESAQQTIKTLNRVFAKRALIDAKEIGKEAPVWALEVLDAEGLKDAFSGGLISKEQALNAYAKRKGGR